MAGTAQRLDGGSTASPRIRRDTSGATDRRAVGAVSSAGRRNGTGNGGAGRQHNWNMIFDGRRVVLEITAGRLHNPVGRELLPGLQLPGEGRCNRRPAVVAPAMFGRLPDQRDL